MELCKTDLGQHLRKICKLSKGHTLEFNIRVLPIFVHAHNHMSLDPTSMILDIMLIYDTRNAREESRRRPYR